MPDKEQNWPSFVVETVLEVLGSAAGEYEEVMENGWVTKTVEYQDSRGFGLAGGQTSREHRL